MADNYLERRMADYREGRNSMSAQARRATLASATKSQPTVMILGGETPEGEKQIAYLRSLGWRVAFSHPDLQQGRRIAQSSGAQHHPIDPADLPQLQRSIDHIIKNWGHLDLTLNFTSGQIAMPTDTASSLLNIR